MKKVVIVGGGFAGVKCALELANAKDYKVTIISNKMNFEYHAALYRTATGRSPKEVALPINHLVAHAKNIEFVIDRIVEINNEKKCVTGDDGDYYEYDILVMAVGQVANYYGIEGIEENSFSLDTITNTIALRKHLHDMIDKNTKDSYSFVVVGAGASGVELAAELGGYIKQLARAHKKGEKKVHVTLIEGAPRVLPLLSPKVSKATLKRLRSRGVAVYLNKHVSGYKDNILTFEGHKINSETLVWTAGAKNNPIFSKHDKIFTLNERGKVVVDQYMQAAEDIYVLGDNAATKYSGMAQTALFDATFLSHNLKRQAAGHQPFKYMPRKPIYAVPIGGRQAILQWGFVMMYGYPAWLVRRLADLRIMREFQPLRDAIKAWRAGNKKAHSGCDIC